MIDHPDSRLYLFAPLPIGVAAHLAGSNDLDGAQSGRALVADHRRHITIANLNCADVPQDYMIAAMDWILSTIPPFAFHVVFDQLIVSPRNALLKASLPLAGVRECQAHVAEMLGCRGVDLPRAALPVPHVPLGYEYREGHGVRPIDGLSWVVEELILVRSLHGLTVHEHLARWRLPARPISASPTSRKHAAGAA